MAPKPKAPDYGVMLAVIVLLGLGLVMVFSSSFVKAEAINRDALYYLKRQAAWAGLGVLAMFALSRVEYWRWKRWATPVFFVNLVLLVAVLFTPAVKGARRWFGVGQYSFQPSELVKVTFVIFLAYLLARQPDAVKHLWRGVLPRLILLGVVFGLIMLEPDMGTAVSLSATVLVMLFAAGARVKHLVGIALSAVPVLGVLVAVAPYRLQRITSFIDPFKDPQGTGYHIIQGLYALGSGGLFGVGLGQSRQKFFYLPEQHTDFIFAILGEELGFLGAVVVVALFFLIAWRGYMVAATAPDAFAALLAAGITTMVTIQAAINIGVVTSSLPVTGIPLPLLSYGGSALLFTLAGLGILLNISRYTTR